MVDDDERTACCECGREGQPGRVITVADACEGDWFPSEDQAWLCVECEEAGQMTEDSYWRAPEPHADDLPF